MSVPVYYGGQGGQLLRMAGGQTENQGGQKKKKFPRFAPNFI